MPKGQSPRQNSLVKLDLLDKKLKDAKDVGTFRKIKSLFQAYTSEFKGNKTPAERKKIDSLTLKFDKRFDSMLKNANKLGGDL